MKPRGKALLAGVVVALVAVFAVIWTTRDKPVELTAGTASYAVRLTVDSPRIGGNAVLVEVTDLAGAPVVADEVTVEPVMADMGHALTPVPATAAAPGHYRADPTDLPMAGLWELTVTVRRDRASEHAVFTLVI
ncbi:FixH family protein [Actinokineospora auranticolor]|uniref:YtkA-like protein n=1 Tax=Actinokineospora auranticolor TaxID=155976 RepID=A0A2S6H087_9PSEU|nr:FixH family protein [Actinokineospora auranticolor]PPK70895.1 YtkA-like protein [Actinokineospora auranticolor]